MLPSGKSSMQLKSRGQILEETIQIIQRLNLKRAKFLAGVSLSSVCALESWIDSTILELSSKRATKKRNEPRRPVQLSEVLKSFVDIYLTDSEWKYGEVWEVDAHLKNVSLAFSIVNSEKSMVTQRLQAFGKASEKLVDTILKSRNGMLFRGISSCAPEWVDEYGLEIGQFERGALAQSHGLKTIQSMPVTSSGKHCAAMLIFGDVERRPFNVFKMEKLKDYVVTIARRHLRYFQILETPGASVGRQKEKAKAGKKSVAILPGNSHRPSMNSSSHESFQGHK